MIRIRITYCCNRIDFASGFYLEDPGTWNDKKGEFQDTNNPINTALAEQRREIEEAFQFFQTRGFLPTPEELRKKIKGSYREEDKKRPSDLFDIFNLFIAENRSKNAWTDATIEKFRVMKKDLQKFNPFITFDDFTEETLIDLVCYYRDKCLLKNSTIEKKMDFLRWFLNWATDRNFNQRLDYKRFKTSLKKTQKKVVFLTREELLLLRNFSAPKGDRKLEKVKDVFLFCCFSGLRHSDVYNLKRSDIQEDHFEITTVKTADSLSIELNDVTKSILNKYSGKAFKQNRALPVICNQAMNRDLKTLCKMAGIKDSVRTTYYRGNKRVDEVKEKWELVGTHTGRRTFVVNALSLGIPPSIVMKWTGHSDYKSMKPYIDIVDNIKATEMTKMNNLLSI